MYFGDSTVTEIYPKTMGKGNSGKEVKVLLLSRYLAVMAAGEI
jgi:hypothetical protein